MSERDVKGKRQYDNTARAKQAGATRHRILEAAYQLIITNGYAGTTIKAVATEAGVSAETVYKAFGTKAKLVKDVYDVTLSGDEESVPMVERPEFQALIAEPSARGKLVHYAAVCRMVSSRLGLLLDVLLSGAKGGDPDLREFAETIKQERLLGATAIVRQVLQTGGARAGLDADRARDLIWTLNSPEVYQLLCRERGWTDAEYEDWLAGNFIAALIG
jgi:AcrR family transcriptional regulator